MKRLIVLGFILCTLACSSVSSPPRESAAALEDQQLHRQPEPKPDIDQQQPELQPQDPQPGYRILKQGRHKQDNWLELNEFFPIHYLYTDIFQRFDLHKRFTLEDKIRIFAGVLYNLDYQAPVNLIIDNYNEEGSLVVSLQLVHIGQRRSVLLATNTDPEGKRIFIGAENVAKTYKRTYIIVEDQLIAVADLYSGKKEARLIDENCADKLARFYIFDGNLSNDTVAEGLLIGSIREAESALERSRSELTLCRYYMSQNRLVEAQALLLAVGAQLAHAGDDTSLSELFSVTYEELLITNALREHEQRLRENRPKSL